MNLLLKSMVILIIILGLIIYFLVVKPFLKERSANNFKSYTAVPDRIKNLIDNENVLELSKIITDLEIRREYKMAKIILYAIDSKGFGFARRVDKIRNEMRIQAGLGPLKKI